MSSTTPAPNTVIVSRCASRWLPPGSNRSITHDVGVSASAVSGGCSACLRAVAEVGEAVPAGDRVGLRVVVDLVAEDRLGALGQHHVADAQRERAEHDQQQDAPEPAVVGHALGQSACARRDHGCVACITGSRASSSGTVGSATASVHPERDRHAEHDEHRHEAARRAGPGRRRRGPSRQRRCADGHRDEHEQRHEVARPGCRRPRRAPGVVQ